MTAQDGASAQSWVTKAKMWSPSGDGIHCGPMQKGSNRGKHVPGALEMQLCPAENPALRYAPCWAVMTRPAGFACHLVKFLSTFERRPGANNSRCFAPLRMTCWLDVSLILIPRAGLLLAIAACLAKAG